MNFQKIDMASWNRREIYKFFDDSIMYFTVELDIAEFLSEIKSLGLRFYPCMLYCIGSVVNKDDAFRYGYDDSGAIGIFDKVDLLYTVPRTDDPSLFSMAATEYQDDFHGFYNAFLSDSKAAASSGKLLPADPLPKNLMGITTIPELHYSGFAFGGNGVKEDLTPFIVLGGYRKDDKGTTTLPVTGEFCHSVNDGYHISKFFESLRREMDALRDKI